MTPAATSTAPALTDDDFSVAAIAAHAADARWLVVTVDDWQDVDGHVFDAVPQGRYPFEALHAGRYDHCGGSTVAWLLIDLADGAVVDGGWHPAVADPAFDRMHPGTVDRIRRTAEWLRGYDDPTVLVEWNAEYGEVSASLRNGADRFTDRLAELDAGAGTGCGCLGPAAAAWAVVRPDLSVTRHVHPDLR